MSQTVFNLTSDLTGPGVLTTQKLVTKGKRFFWSIGEWWGGGSRRESVGETDQNAQHLCETVKEQTL